MVKASSQCVVKSENCEDGEMDFATQQMSERKRILKLVSNFKGSEIAKPTHKRSARLATKQAAAAPSPRPAFPKPENQDDLESALIDTEELVSGSLLDPSIDDCWFPQAQASTMDLADMDEISAELDLDEMSCSSGASDCTIPDSASHATSLDDLDEVLGERPAPKKRAHKNKNKASSSTPLPEASTLVPAPVSQNPYPGAMPMPAGPMRLNLGGGKAPATGRALPYQYTGVTLTIGGRKSAAYTRKPVAVHGGIRIRAHLGFAANLAAVCANGM
jgi:hypothetical protein